MNNLCSVCNIRQNYPGSKWCSNSCRFSGKPNSANYKGNVAVTQGTPLCVYCNNKAYFDPLKNKFSPGCNRTHANLAISQNIFNPR